MILVEVGKKRNCCNQSFSKIRSNLLNAIHHHLGREKFLTKFLNASFFVFLYSQKVRARKNEFIKNFFSLLFFIRKYSCRSADGFFIISIHELFILLVSPISSPSSFLLLICVGYALYSLLFLVDCSLFFII